MKHTEQFQPRERESEPVIPANPKKRSVGRNCWGGGGDPSDEEN